MIIKFSDKERFTELSKAFGVDVDEQTGELVVFVDKTWIKENLVPKHLNESLTEIIDRRLAGNVFDPQKEEIEAIDDPINYGCCGI